MKIFRFKTYQEDEALENFLNQMSDVSKYLKNLVNMDRQGLLNTNEEDLDFKFKRFKVMKMEFDAKIKKWEYEHRETFGKSPSSQGQNAIETRATTEITDDVTQYFSVIPDKFSSKYVDLKCLVANCEMIHSHVDSIKIDMLRHLTNFHSGVVMKNE